MTVRFALCSLAALALSCSSSVELSGDAHLVASDDPTVLGSINERILAVAVDDERVYWFGAQSEFHWTGVGALHSCKKAQCIGSLVTYDSGAARPLRFAVSKGRIHWIQQVERAGNKTSLRECDVTGCDQGSTAIPIPSNLSVVSAAFADGFWYVVAGQHEIFQLSTTGGEAPLALVNGVEAVLTVRDGYVYFTRQSRGTDQSKSAIARVQIDERVVQTIAEDLDLIRNAPLVDASGVIDFANRSQVALDANYIYWGQGDLRGSISRCPTSGCLRDPEIVVPLIRSPSSLLIDRAQLYFRHETVRQGAAISKCDLPECLPSDPVVTRLDVANQFAVDDHSLYAAFTEQDFDTDAAWSSPSAQIRRVAK